jgi:DNA-binding NtrC family response regulator
LSGTILVIDHELDNVKTLKNLLSKKGYEVKVATSSHKAIEIFKAESFDIVITEVRMPRFEGGNLIRKLKDLNESIEIIVLTGFWTLDYAMQVHGGNGAFAYLTKPLEDIEQLYTTVSQALEKHKSQQGKRLPTNK